MVINRALRADRLCGVTTCRVDFVSASLQGAARPGEKPTRVRGRGGQISENADEDAKYPAGSRH